MAALCDIQFCIVYASLLVRSQSFKYTSYDDDDIIVDLNVQGAAWLNNCDA